MPGSIARAAKRAGFDLLVFVQPPSDDWHKDYEDSRRADGLILLGYGDWETHRECPRQSFWGLWNLSFGFFGIQVAFAYQNTNVFGIFQSLATSIYNLASLWAAGPVTGLPVQPVIGYFSDMIWTPPGRRRPYLLAGAILASLAMPGLPNSPSLWFAASMQWIH